MRSFKRAFIFIKNLIKVYYWKFRHRKLLRQLKAAGHIIPAKYIKLPSNTFIDPNGLILGTMKIDNTKAMALSMKKYPRAEKLKSISVKSGY